MNPVKLLVLSASVLAINAPAVLADDISEADAKRLLSLSLAELSNVTITSVSKKEEPENEAPAAIYVVTQEDIRRSGATSIPEALRGVPGITVTQSGSSNWTVTARGFNDQFSNKLLVLVDGRTVYSPLFSGVYWDQQDTMLEDIERIEVIRGPGATLWGANAVNGVINIITKNAKDTQNGLAVASYGNQSNGEAVRYGAKVGDNSYVRTYIKTTNFDSQYNTDGSHAGDAWRRQQAGFRGDLKITERDNLKIQGDIYSIDEHNPYMVPDLNSGTYYSASKGLKSDGGNLLMRWEQKQSDKSETSLQAYFDHSYRKTSLFNDDANTFDVEFQHTWTGWARQELIWGGGYRFINDTNDPTYLYQLAPATRNDSLYSAFLQDKFTLVPESVFLTLGSKFEHNVYSGYEVQPSARVTWLPTKNQTVWGAVSRAVHTPSRFDFDGHLIYSIDPTFPTVFTSDPNKHVDSEDMIAYELGYRIQPMKTLSLDVTGYYNDYKNLLNDVLEPFSIPSYVLQPISVANTNKAYSAGFEVAVKYNVMPAWQLSSSYSYIDLVFKDKQELVFFFLGKHPKNMFNLSSTYLFPNRLEMTNSLYSVSELNSIAIPSYVRFDTKFSYPLTDNIDVSLVGQNLLDNRHKEFTQFLFQTQAEIGRSVYANLAFKF